MWKHTFTRRKRYYDSVVTKEIRARQKKRAQQMNHSDTDFEEGIFYKARLIGYKDISKPKDRSSIVAVMRDIRLDYKAKNVKKQHVTVSVSTDGIKVSLAKKPYRTNYHIG